MQRTGRLIAAEHDDELKERDDFRKDRAKERQRDRNVARAAPDKRSVGVVGVSRGSTWIFRYCSSQLSSTDY